MELLLALQIALGLLMVDSIIELGFITAMVSWLHVSTSGTWAVNFKGSTFELWGQPLHLLVDQGHTSNGAAGTAFVAIGLGGIVNFFLRSRPGLLGQKFTNFYHYLWLTITVLGFFLTVAALAFVFAVTNAHEGQTINVAFASTVGDHLYPLDTWTPQNWFPAVLQLDLVDAAVRSDIEMHIHIMRAWQYNLIPMFVIQLVMTVLAVMETLQSRKSKPHASRYDHVEQKPSSPL